MALCKRYNNNDHYYFQSVFSLETLWPTIDQVIFIHLFHRWWSSWLRAFCPSATSPTTSAVSRSTWPSSETSSSWGLQDFQSILMSFRKMPVTGIQVTFLDAVIMHSSSVKHYCLFSDAEKIQNQLHSYQQSWL